MYIKDEDFCVAWFVATVSRFFIDDVPANIEGANYCGIPGAVFHNDVKLLRRSLRSAGVRVRE